MVPRLSPSGNVMHVVLCTVLSGTGKGNSSVKVSGAIIVSGFGRNPKKSPFHSPRDT